MIAILESHHPVDVVVLMLGHERPQASLGLVGVGHCAGRADARRDDPGERAGARPPATGSPAGCAASDVRGGHILRGHVRRGRTRSRSASAITSGWCRTRRGAGSWTPANTSCHLPGMAFISTLLSCQSSPSPWPRRCARCCLERGRRRPAPARAGPRAGQSFAAAISSTGAAIDVQLAQEQHAAYCRALGQAGVTVEALAARRALPRQLLHAGPGACHRRPSDHRPARRIEPPWRGDAGRAGPPAAFPDH